MAWLDARDLQQLRSMRRGPRIIGLQVNTLLKYGLLLLLYVLLGILFVWSRAEVKAASVEIDKSRRLLNELTRQHQRLELEFSVRRDLHLLSQQSKRLGLEPVEDVRVVGP